MVLLNITGVMYVLSFTCNH